jgi:hypothetical protein
MKTSPLATSAQGIKRQFFGPGNPDWQIQPGLNNNNNRTRVINMQAESRGNSQAG